MVETEEIGQEEEVDIDWTSARGQAILPPREPRIEWTEATDPEEKSLISTGLPPEVKEFLPPREPRERRQTKKRRTRIDWSLLEDKARFHQEKLEREVSETPKRDEPEFD